MSTFAYFGEEFAYAEEFPVFAYAEFCEAMEEPDVSPMKATGIALRLAKGCVVAADLPRFLAVSRKNNAKIEDWLKVFYGWTEAETGRPTSQPIGSSDGLEVTPPSSESQPEPEVSSRTETRPMRGDRALALVRSA